jgi:hypothetical protein
MSLVRDPSRDLDPGPGIAPHRAELVALRWAAAVLEKLWP